MLGLLSAFLGLPVLVLSPVLGDSVLGILLKVNPLWYLVREVGKGQS